jgi:uncharacterized protein (TIGR03437 family)
MGLRYRKPMRLLVVLAAALPLYSQITIDTFAGGAVRSGIPAQNVMLESVGGPAWDPAGNVVFSDGQSNVIQRVRPDGVLETVAGTGGMGYRGDGGPATVALLNQPSGPRCDAGGNLYFVDAGNFRIRRVDTKGIITTVAGDGIPWIAGMDTNGPATERSIGNVSGLAVDPAGRIYFAEGFPSRVRAVGTDGQVRDFLSVGPYDYITALATDGAGNVYVEDSITIQHVILYRVTPDGTASIFREWTATGSASANAFPMQVADSAGNLYGVVSNNGIGGKIERMTPDGTITVVAGGGGPGYVSSPDGPALNAVIYPAGLAVDAKGNLAFGDTFTPVACCNMRLEIREVTADGQLKTLAGANGQIVPDGTPLLSAWLLRPTSIAFSKTGDLYVAEAGACKIRKIGSDGVLTTFAGTGDCAYPSPGVNAKNAAIPQPGSIAVDSQNRLWMADGLLNLYSIAQDGTVGKVIKTPVEGGTGKIAIDGKDRVYVLGLDSLYRVLADGTYQALIPPPSNGGSGKITDLTGIGADASGQVYFTASGTIYRVNDDGTITPLFQTVNNPNSLAFDAAHRIWQGEGSEIDVMNAAADMVRLGLSRAGITGDGGPVNAARMSTASSLAFSPAGDLYLIDGTRVRRLTGIGNAVAAPSISAVVNAASYASGPIAPGEIVAIFGSNFGTSGLEVAMPDNNAYPLGVGRTRVLFNGIPGVVLAVAPGQINAIPPGAFAEPVVVEVDATFSAPASLPAAPAAPGIAAIVNQDGTVNSPANPAARGSIVSLYGTGLGAMTPQLLPGALAISTPFPQPVGTVTVTIGGLPAQVVYAGDAPFEVDGAFQVNVQIPAGAAVGNDAVTVSVGSVGSGQTVTVAVK